jgi:hypothetical protein
MKQDDIDAIAGAGLNRIHIGLESGSDAVLKMVKKGCTKEMHITAGRKVKAAGMELSEYVMPGLGGRKLSREHALETADALNRIDPDFIRLRSLAIPSKLPLYEEFKSGRFEKCTDTMMAEEILLFLENLSGITSTVKSDHILNLLQDVEGKLPGDREKMLSAVKSFLALDGESRMHYQVGRRIGLFAGVGDMTDGAGLSRVKAICHEEGVTPENVDSVVDQLMNRFI